MNAIGSPAAYRFSVAPMLDCTDRHFRVLMRQISRRALLYSEMVVAQALHHSKRRNKLLDFDPCLLYTSPSPRDRQKSRMPSSA